MDEERSCGTLFSLEWKKERFFSGFLKHLLSLVAARFLWQHRLRILDRYQVVLPVNNNKNKSI